METYTIGALIVVSATALLTTITINLLTHLRLGRKVARADDVDLPPISVLKPVKGVDEGLWENLVALAEQEYPEFEILIGAADADDPALDVARRLRDAYPDVAIEVVHCRRPIGLNPKVNNLVGLSDVAAHDTVLVSDSNCRPNPGYLRAVGADSTRPGVGLVAAIVAGTGERSWGAVFENLHLNSFVAGAVGASPFFGHPCVLGKSMLFRLSDLEALGGWRSVCNVLAEDYVLGRRFHRSGRRVHTTSHVVPTINGGWTFERFHARHVRWGQMRRRLSPGHYLLEPLTNPTPFFVALAVAFLLSSGPTPWLLVVGCLAEVFGKTLLDDILCRRLRGTGIGLKGWVAAPAKDVYVLWMWLIGAFKRTVVWRGHSFIVGTGSSLSSVEGRSLDELVEQSQAA